MVQIKLGHRTDPSPEMEFIVGSFFEGMTNSMLAYTDKISKNILVNIVAFFWYGIRNNTGIPKARRAGFEKELNRCYSTDVRETDLFDIIKQAFEYGDMCGLRVNFNSPGGAKANERLHRSDLITPENYLIVRFYKQMVNSYIDAEVDPVKWITATRLVKVFWCAIRIEFPIEGREEGDKLVFGEEVGRHELAKYVLGKAGDCGILMSGRRTINYDNDMERAP